MAHLDIYVAGSKFDEATAHKLADSLRPVSAAAAQKQIAEFESPPSGLDAPIVAHLQSVVEEGGSVFAHVESLKQWNGVVRGGPFPLEEIALQDLNDFENAKVTYGSGSSGHWGSVSINANEFGCNASLDVPHDQIERVRDIVTVVLEEAIDPGRLTALARPFKVFIAHGAESQWKVLQRLLQDSHGFTVEAFETEERAGYGTLAIVEQMVKSSSVAVVVMTGEDQMHDGSVRARENVVHELGFCQGALGIDRTIVLLENGISEPSNIAGMTQIRFAKGNLIDVEDKIVSALDLRKRADEYSQR